MSGAARLGDAMTHGAHIIGGSPNMTINGLPAARLGDPVICPIHGQTQIVAGCAPTMTVNGLVVGRLGAKAGCGAVVVSASPNMEV